MKATTSLATSCRRLLLWGVLTLQCLFSTAQKRFTADVEQQAEKILSQMTLDEKLSYIGGINWMYTRPLERFGIPQLKMSDGPQGLGTHGPSTAYPCALMLAATWNEQLATEYGSALGKDCRARGVHVVLGPAVNIYRAPMCGRNFEYMGEDPYLTSRMATGYIKGVQGQGVMATIKHFIANNSDYDRDHISSDIDERTLNEIYFPSFRAAVQEAEVGAVMSSYNLLNGIYTTEHPWLLKDVLRQQWGFKGILMSDWGSTHHCIPAVKGGLDLEMPAGSKMQPEELKYYLRTGDITIEMIDEKVRHILQTLLAFGFRETQQPDTHIPLNNPQCAQTALNVASEGLVLLKNTNQILPIRSGKVKTIAVVGKNAQGYVCGGGSGEVHPFQYVSVLDGIRKEAAERGIRVEYLDVYDYLPAIIFTDTERKQKGFRAQYFDNMNLEGTPKVEQTETKINYSWSGGTGLKEMPKEQFSVRWNGTICPQETDEYLFTLGGDDGYRLYIDGKLIADEWHEGAFRNSTYRCMLEAGKKYDLKIEYFQKGGGAAVNFIWKQKNASNNLFVEALNRNDLVVACIGFNSDTEGEGRDRTFELPEDEAQLLQNTLQSKRPVVGIVNAGGNVEMQSWEPSLKGLLWAWYGGQEAGTAIARTLFGELNPSGKLPVTFEKRWEDNPTFHSYYDPDGDKHVEYTEGIFVGYRGYDKLKREVQYPFGYGLSYTRFKLSAPTVGTPKTDGSVTVTYKLTNTGRTAGAEVVQLYVSNKDTTVEHPEKELKGFRKVYLEPGETKSIEITVPAEAFSHYDTGSRRFVIDRGSHDILLGFSSRDIKAKMSVGISR